MQSKYVVAKNTGFRVSSVIYDILIHFRITTIVYCVSPLFLSVEITKQPISVKIPLPLQPARLKGNSLVCVLTYTNM